MPDEPSLLSAPPEAPPEQDLRGKLVLPASPPPYRTPGVVEPPKPPPRLARPTPAPPLTAPEPDPEPQVGDAAGEHLTMGRGRYGAWTYVVIAFVLEALILGALPIYAFRYAFHFFTSNTDISMVAGFVVGLVAAWRVFANRWRCIEAFSSNFCSGLMNLSILYVPFIALIYANVRGLAKLRA